MAQDEASCVVYGMPKAAVELGAVDRVVPLKEMAGHIMLEVEKMGLVRKGGQNS